jgi:ferric-dicitrate binding protein FerR (iron transport regulator)
MPAVLPTPDAAIFAQFTAGDEAGLVGVFRSSYEPLLASAEAALGPDLAHFKGRVVQQALLEAWGERARFANPAGLAGFLDEAIQQLAAAQKRKHASLHLRHGASATQPHVAVPSTEEALSQLLATLHAPPPDHEKLVAEAKAAKRAHAADHVQKVGGRRNLLVPGIVFVVAVAVIVLSLRWLDASSAEAGVDQALKADDVRQIASGRGQRGTVTLGDQSRATIGSDSKVRIPKEFGGQKLRTVELIGTARFAVAEGRPVPFAVRAKNVTVTATGTAFTVRAFPEEDGVTVAVDEGSVSVKVREGGASRSVAAGEAIRVGADGQIGTIEGDALDVALAWVRDSIVFVDAPVKAVIPELVRWFGINAALGDEAIGDRRVSLRLALASSGEATRALNEAANLTIQFGKDDRIEFYDSPPAPPSRAPRRGR